MPALAGSAAEDRNDGPVVNLSYYVFPALTRLSLVAPEIDWNGIMQSGLALLKADTCINAVRDRRAIVPAELRSSPASEKYYPATLRALALIALQMRYPSCLRG